METCKHCQSTDLVANGRTSYGSQRYLCRSCGVTFTGGKMGRPRKINPDPRPLAPTRITISPEHCQIVDRLRSSYSRARFVELAIELAEKHFGDS